MDDIPGPRVRLELEEVGIESPGRTRVAVMLSELYEVVGIGRGWKTRNEE